MKNVEIYLNDAALSPGTAGTIVAQSTGDSIKADVPRFSAASEADRWAEQFAGSIRSDAEWVSLHTGQFSDKKVAHLLALKLKQRFQGRLELNPDGTSLKSNESWSRANLYHHLHQLISSGNFRAAKKLAIGRFENRKIIQLLGMAQGLRQFDFTLEELKTERYWTILNETLEQIEAEEAAEENQFIASFRKVARRDQRSFITYLYNYAELLYNDNNLIDFVVLYYRLAEEALLYALGWDINWTVYEEQKQFHIRDGAPNFLRIPMNEKLSKHYHRYMKVLEKEIYRLNGRPGVVIRPSGAIGLEKLAGRDAYFARIYIAFNDPRFSRFLELRHQGVSGHGFADFNKATFETMLGCTPLEKMDGILEMLGLKPEYSIFELISKAVLALASEEIQEEEHSSFKREGL